MRIIIELLTISKTLRRICLLLVLFAFFGMCYEAGTAPRDSHGIVETTPLFMTYFLSSIFFFCLWLISAFFALIGRTISHDWRRTPIGRAFRDQPVRRRR